MDDDDDDENFNDHLDDDDDDDEDTAACIAYKADTLKHTLVTQYFGTPLILSDKRFAWYIKALHGIVCYW